MSKAAVLIYRDTIGGVASSDHACVPTGKNMHDFRFSTRFPTSTAVATFPFILYTQTIG